MFDISTLVTDRTQADVQAWNEKGTYNPSDLNRVTHAMEYLVERIRSYGYTVNYEKVKVPHQSQKTNHLPEGYTELEYIESTGTQYIDTGVEFSTNNKYIMEAECCFVNGSGSYTGWDAGGQFGIGSTGNWHHGLSSGTTMNISAKIMSAVRMTINAGTSTNTVIDVTQNGATASITRVHSSLGSYAKASYPIFALTNTTGGYSAYANMKVKKFAITVNGTLVRNFIPCKNSSGIVGLYDMVNGVFYANAGTGTFLIGSVVEPPIIEEYDDYTWYHSDIPQTNELNAYLQNVRWLREAMALLPNTPEVPDDMQGFTFTEANDIEQILVNIETIINLMLSSIIYTGEIFSGEVI